MRREAVSREERGPEVRWAEPLSAEQLRFYFLHQLDPRDPDIYICRAMRITGALEAARLRRGVATLVGRHELLRCAVPQVDGQPRLVLPEALAGAGVAELTELGDVVFTSIDLTIHPPLEREARARTLIADELGVAAPFELASGPLFRVTALRLTETEHVVVARFHHILVDGVSAQRFLVELWRAYAEADGADSAEPSSGGPPVEPPAPQFREYLAWEARRQRPEAAAERRAYWAKKLASPPPLDVTLGKLRPPRHTHAAGTVHAALGRSLQAALAAFCQAERTTPYLVMTAITHVLLHQVTGRDDVLVATPVASRHRREHQAVLGVLVNWIALRSRLSAEMSFVELVRELRGELPAAYTHQGSYEELLAAAGAVPRDPSRNPLFQVTVNYARHEPLPEPPGLRVAVEPVEVSRTPYDLALRFEEVGEALSLGLTYYEGAMGRGTAERLCAAFLRLAEHCLAHPRYLLGDAPRPALALPAVVSAAPAPAHRLVVAATFTAEPLRPVLEQWFERLELATELVFAPVDQIFQQLLDPAGALARNQVGTNALLLRLEDWKDPEVAVEELLGLLAARAAAPTLVFLCPPGAAERAAASPTHSRCLARLRAAASASDRLYLLEWQEVLRRYPVEALDDAEGLAYARAPYSVEGNAALATALARQLHATRRPAPKVLVLDCDHTLWRGVVGEDGPGGLVVDEGHRALQQFAVAQAEAGVLLCLASKNNEAEVWEAFATTPGMVLRREQIAAHRIGWEPKSQSLMALAAELNLGVDSFAFFDDSAVECAEVRAGCPAVLTLQVPARSAELPRFLDHLWSFDPRKLTAADRQRTELYAANMRRERLRGEAPDLQRFIASLEVQLSFAEVSAETLPRAAQLTQRTNQFNTTTRRYTEAELAAEQGARAATGGSTLLVEVSDRFGDYGAVGLAISTRRGDVLSVGTLLLSCRALGRGVEHRILAELGRRAAASGCAWVEVEYAATAKNQPARRFLEAVASEFRVRDGGGEGAERADDGCRYLLPVAAAQTAPSLLAAARSDEREASDVGSDAPIASAAPRLHELWRAIPSELDTVAKICSAFAAARVRGRGAAGAPIAPRDELEQAIAGVWRRVLLVEELGVDDDYFALGGDSIRSLALCAAMRQAGLPVSVLELQAHPTIAQLAGLLRGRAPAALEPTVELRSSSAPPASAPPRGPYPLSFAQRYVVATYARHNLSSAPPTGVFHNQERISLREPMRRPSLSALRRAVALVVRHTASLRSKLVRDGEGWQQVELASYPDVLTVLDLSALPAGAQQARIAKLLLEDRARPFDPERSGEALLRCYAVVTGADTLELIVTTHHGFCDGWSLQAAYNHLFAAYEAAQCGDEARLAEVERALIERDGLYRELVEREQRALAAPAAHLASAVAEPAAPPLPGRRRGATRQPPSEGEPETLLAPLPWTHVDRAGERAITTRTSLKAVLLDAFTAVLARRLELPSSLVIAVVTNARKDDLPRPMDLFGLCWTLAPVTIPLARDRRGRATSLASPVSLHKELLATEARARTPIDQMFQGLAPEAVAHASFNFTSFHNARWRSGTAHLQLVKQEPFHRFPFPLDFGVRLDEPSRTATLKLSAAPGAGLDTEGLRGLLEDFLAELAPTGWHPGRQEG